MKSRKGFTLLELLAVIIILGLIGLLVLPVIQRTLRQTRNDLYDAQITNIINGAKSWIADHPYSIPKNNLDTLTISLSQLKMGSYIDLKFSNPITDRMFDGGTKIIIKKVDNTYEYNVEIGNEEDDPNRQLHYPSIEIPNGYLEYITINKEYSELGLIVNGIVMGDGYDDEIYSLTITTDMVNSEGVKSLEGYAAEQGNYTVKYELINKSDGQKTILYRSIIVGDFN